MPTVQGPWFPLRASDAVYLRPRALSGVPVGRGHNDNAPVNVNAFVGFAVRDGLVWALGDPGAIGSGTPWFKQRVRPWALYRHEADPFAPELGVYPSARAPGAPSRWEGADPVDFCLAVGLGALGEMVTSWGWYVVAVPRDQTDGARFLPGYEAGYLGPATAAPVLLRVGPATLRTLAGEDLAVVLDADTSALWEGIFGAATPAWKPRVGRAAEAASERGQVATVPAFTSTAEAFGGAIDPTVYDVAPGGGPRWWEVAHRLDPAANADRTRRTVVSLGELAALGGPPVVAALDSSVGRWYVGQIA